NRQGVRTLKIKPVLCKNMACIAFVCNVILLQTKEKLIQVLRNGGDHDIRHGIQHPAVQSE
ncbi:MAG: hypothetical protein M3Z49_12935, partial [Bifidobacteriales bacterium]|nr:hypothetical protein [Bifidobacteriales bacterium]